MLKTTLGFIVLLTASSFARSQDDDSTGAKQFDIALAHYSNGNLDSAVIVWTYMVENKIAVRYDTYGNAFFNIPTVYWEMKEFDKAKEWYLKIIDSDLRDWDETGLLMEPHTNYKHKSAVALAGLYNREENWVQTLHWLNLADTVYRYWGFEGSGTSISKRQAYLLDWRVEVLLKTDSTKQAVRALITELICAGYLADFFEQAEEQLATLITKEDRIEFARAIEALTISPVSEHEWVAQFTFQDLVYRIPISDEYPDRNIPHYWRKIFIEKGATPEPKDIIDVIKSSSFYRRW